MTLAQEIQKLDLELAEKKKKLLLIQQSEIEKVISDFVNLIEKSGFDKVQVKKLVIEKMTRKNKKRN